jgi:hypothetical protein
VLRGCSGGDWLQLSAHTSQLRQWSCSGKPLVKAPFLQRLPLLGELKPHHGVCSPAQYAQVFDISDFRRDPHRRQGECGLWKNEEGEAFLLSVVPWLPSFCLSIPNFTIF